MPAADAGLGFATSAPGTEPGAPRTESRSRSKSGRSSSVKGSGSETGRGTARGMDGGAGRVAMAGAGAALSGLISSSISSRCVRSSSASSLEGTMMAAPQCGHLVSDPAFRRAIPSNRLQELQRNRMGIPTLRSPTPGTQGGWFSISRARGRCRFRKLDPRALSGNNEVAVFRREIAS